MATSKGSCTEFLQRCGEKVKGVGGEEQAFKREERRKQLEEMKKVEKLEAELMKLEEKGRQPNLQSKDKADNEKQIAAKRSELEKAKRAGKIGPGDTTQQDVGRKQREVDGRAA